MPDKHEVGGSSPLGPTRAQACSGKRGREERVLHRRYKYASAESDSKSTWANQSTTCLGGKAQVQPKFDTSASPMELVFVKFSKHLSKIKCFENLMNN